MERQHLGQPGVAQRAVRRPTEIWARFSALDASGPKNTSGGGGNFVAYLDGSQRQPFNGIAPPAFLAFVTIGGNSETLDRDHSTYSAEVGVRTHFNFGGLRVSPGAFVGYDRLDEHDKITQSINTPDVPFFGLDTKLKSDYYRFGLGLGTSLPITALGRCPGSPTRAHRQTSCAPILTPA